MGVCPITLGTVDHHLRHAHGFTQSVRWIDGIMGGVETRDHIEALVD
jgi:hypothetical protein